MGSNDGQESAMARSRNHSGHLTVRTSGNNAAKTNPSTRRRNKRSKQDDPRRERCPTRAHRSEVAVAQESRPAVRDKAADEDTLTPSSDDEDVEEILHSSDDDGAQPTPPVGQAEEGDDEAEENHDGAAGDGSDDEEDGAHTNKAVAPSERSRLERDNRKDVAVVHRANPTNNGESTLTESGTGSSSLSKLGEVEKSSLNLELAESFFKRVKFVNDKTFDKDSTGILKKSYEVLGYGSQQKREMMRSQLVGFWKARIGRMRDYFVIGVKESVMSMYGKPTWIFQSVLLAFLVVASNLTVVLHRRFGIEHN